MFFLTGNQPGGGGGTVTTISSTGAVTTTTMVNPANVAVQGQPQVGQPVYMHQMPAGMKVRARHQQAHRNHLVTQRCRVPLSFMPFPSRIFSLQAIPGEMPPAGFQLANPQFRGVPTPIASAGSGGGGGVPTYGSPATMPTAPQPTTSYGTPVTMAGGMPMVMMSTNNAQQQQPSVGGYSTMGIAAPTTTPGGPTIGYGTPMYMTQQTHVQPPGGAAGGYMPQPLPAPSSAAGSHAVASLPPIPVQTVGFGGGMPSGTGYGSATGYGSSAGFGSSGGFGASPSYGMQPLPMPPAASSAGGAAPPAYNSHALSL